VPGPHSQIITRGYGTLASQSRIIMRGYAGAVTAVTRKVAEIVKLAGTLTSIVNLEGTWRR